MIGCLRTILRLSLGVADALLVESAGVFAIEGVAGGAVGANHC